MRLHSPQEFVSRLSADQLGDPEQLSVVGMVKAVDGASKSISFTTCGCEKWLSLPIDVVESIAHIKDVSCDDHRHPLVVLKFKAAEELDESARFFIGLAAQLQAAVNEASRNNTGKVDQASRPRPLSNCSIVEEVAGAGLTICCWVDTPSGGEIVCTGMV